MGAAYLSVSVSQSHLRDVMYALNMRVLSRPIVHVGNTPQKFDAAGNLTDAATKKLLVKVKDKLIAAIG